MLLDTLQAFPEALSTHKDAIYLALGLAIGSIVLKYLSKVNQVEEGEPPLLPGAKPIFGHALAFLKDSNKVYETARDWSPNSHPVSLSIFGKRLYVVLNSKDMSAAWRTKTLSFNPITEWGLSKMFGMNKDGCAKLKDDPDGLGDMYENQHQFWREAFGPGGGLDALNKKFLHFLEDDMNNVERAVHNAPNGEETVSLRWWCRDHLGIPTTNAMIGPQMLEYFPEIFDHLSNWDREFFKLAMGLPKWMTGKAHPSLDAMIKAFMKWGSPERMISSMRIRGEMMKARDISDRDIAAGHFSLWMATQANANPTSFWLLYQVLLRPKERAIIEKEIAPAFAPSTADPNVETLTDLNFLMESTPTLNAMYWEVLRYGSASASVREVTETSTVSGWKFVKGSMVMIPVRPLHQDPKIFGEDVDSYVADRFLHDFVKTDAANGKTATGKLPSVKALKPFGGGETLCPGRHFAANENVAFVAIALRRFEFTLVEGQTVAKPLTSFPVIGTYPPDREIMVRIRARQRK